jgi:L,D-peptidoglycan transpeptidase YkuD (ErfK/YbiS/YcfS/YnhG family)
MSTRTRLKAPQLLVRRLSDRALTGVLECGPLRLRCALGRGGVKARKREGDGATPRGRMALRTVHYNPARAGRPATGLPVSAIRLNDGWCDASGDRNYNRYVCHPYPASAERLWRPDGVYDVIIVLDYNVRPRVRGLGSAIFMHVARPDYPPTEGCIALGLRDLQNMLKRLRPGSHLITAR